MIIGESDKYLFEQMSVPKAVMTLAIPTIISQVVTMIYNLADTFFIGQLGNPGMVAAVSLVSPWFNLLTALGNLFGLGASSLISRFMGAGRTGDIKYVSSFSIWAGVVVTALFSILSYLFREPLLGFLGASSGTYVYAESYLFWVVCIGGVPTMVSLALGHLLRSEGHAKAVKHRHDVWRNPECVARPCVHLHLRHGGRRCCDSDNVVKCPVCRLLRSDLPQAW